MRRATLLPLGLLCLGSTLGQMVVPSGTSLSIDEGTSVRINTPLTWSLEAGSSVVNDGDITLGPEAQLNEAIGAAITGSGTERTTRDLSAPLADEDPGGLGGILTTNTSLGNTLVVRGHVPYTDYSGHTSIARWIGFSPANNAGLNATLAFRYDPAELNGLQESSQRLHIRASQDIWWSLASAVSIGAHTVTSSGLDSLGLFTTYDEDLPNVVTSMEKAGAFALFGEPGGTMHLRVPAGARAESLEVFALNGTRIAALAPHWGEGVHALPDLALAHGLYQLRVNARTTLTFLRP